MSRIRRLLERAQWHLRSAGYEREKAREATALPTVSQPRPDLTRFGEGGAGYYLARTPLRAGGVVYSVGVGSEISFDRALLGALPVEVFAFDPTEQSAAFIADTQVPDRFRFEQLAVGPADGEMELRAVKPGSARYLAGSLLKLPSGSAPTRVPTQRLGSIMQRLGHDRLAALKLDIEGGEYAVLGQVLADRIPVDQITCEFHPHLLNLVETGSLRGRSGWHQTAQTIEQLVALGYQIVWRSDRGTEFTFLHPRASDQPAPH